MSRTIVYATRQDAAAQGPSALARNQAGSGVDVDGYLERLAKYVPGEILTGFAPLALLVKDRPEALTLVSIAFLALTPVYLYITRVIQPEANRPKFRPYMYLLSACAFIVWALTTSVPFRELVAGRVSGFVKLDDVAATIILVLGALLIPAIDIILDYRLARRGH